MKTENELHRSILREFNHRGVVGNTLNSTDAYAIGKAFGTMIKRNNGKSVCVGYDGRTSSTDMTNAVVDGLVSTGMAIIRIDIGPTPMLHFAENLLNTDRSIVVKSSHNSADDNEYTMVINIQSFFDEDNQILRRICAEEDYEEGEGFSIQCTLVDRQVTRGANGFGDLRGLDVAGGTW